MSNVSLATSGSVNTRAAVAVPVTRKLLVAALPMNTEENGRAAEPRVVPPAALAVTGPKKDDAPAAVKDRGVVSLAATLEVLKFQAAPIRALSRKRAKAVFGKKSTTALPPVLLIFREFTPAVCVVKSHLPATVLLRASINVVELRKLTP